MDSPISCGLHGVSAQGPPNVGYRLTSELRLSPSVVKSAPNAKETRFGSVSAARMKVNRPIMPNWSVTMDVGMLVTKPDGLVWIPRRGCWSCCRTGTSPGPAVPKKKHQISYLENKIKDQLWTLNADRLVGNIMF